MAKKRLPSHLHISYRGKKAALNIKPGAVDLFNLPYWNESFSTISISQKAWQKVPFHHRPKLLYELRRLLKKEGKLIVPLPHLDKAMGFAKKGKEWRKISYIAQVPIERKDEIKELTRLGWKELAKLYPGRTPPQDVKEMWKKGDIWGIFLNNRIISYGGIKKKAHEIEIGRIFTHPSYQGKGYASELIIHVIKHYGPQRVMVKGAKHPKALLLYACLGFHFVQEEKGEWIWELVL